MVEVLLIVIIDILPIIMLLQGTPPHTNPAPNAEFWPRQGLGYSPGPVVVEVSPDLGLNSTKMMNRIVGTGLRRGVRCMSSSSSGSKPVDSLAVLGAGQMGVGIAYVAAANAKVPVQLVDNSEASLSKGNAFVEKLLTKNVSKGKITEEEAKEIRSRITFADNTATAVSKVSMVIEAVPEIPKLKFDIFDQLAKNCHESAILATNTSSIGITKIAAYAKGAEDRVIGAHFMNPVPVQPGVEIIVGLQTSKDTLERTLEFTGRMKKIPSKANDYPGFLANRVLLPYINEAIIALETGVGEKEDIDSIMKNGCAMPMGPLQLADFIGLDTCYSIMNVLYHDTADSKYRPSMLLGKMVDAGWLGVKSGKGFYDYSKK